jgi:hypothetical protein
MVLEEQSLCSLICEASLLTLSNCYSLRNEHNQFKHRFSEKWTRLLGIMI